MSAKKIDYKELSAELDEVLAKLQSATDLDVDEAVKAYERGMEIAKELESYLKEAENKVTKIKADWEARSKEG
jgi:exodeoxyribonuclease VII small subunit